MSRITPIAAAALAYNGLSEHSPVHGRYHRAKGHPSRQAGMINHGSTGASSLSSAQARSSASLRPYG